MTAPREAQPASQLARRWIITLATILIVAPFAVFAWKTHRDAEVSRAGLDPRLALMVRIPAGEFSMGTDKADEKHAEEAPGHSVHLKGFWMDVTEVTNAQFTAFADATGFVTDAEKDLSARDFPNAPPEYLKGGSLLFKKVAGVNPFQCGVGNLPWWKFTAGANWRHPEGLGSDIKNRLNHPVICLTYKDAQAFAKWAGKRLPTEAEWEYAARGGLKNKAYVWGDEERPGGKVMCNHWQGKFPERDTAEDGFAGIAPVKSFPANGYGLYDMAGNVWEMCEDWYQPTYYRVSPKDAPSGPAIGHDPEGTGYGQHVIRGGSWLCDEGYCLRYRATARQGLDTLTSTNHAGFRCVRDEATPANK